MSFPRDVVSWAEDPSALVIEPSAGEKAAGWVPEQEPPAHWMNWFKRQVGRMYTALQLMEFRNRTEVQISADSTYIWDADFAGESAGVGGGRYLLVADKQGGAMKAYVGSEVLGFVTCTPPAKNKDLYSCCWAPSAGLFVAVGESDTGDALIVTMPNPAGSNTLTERTNPGSVASLFCVRSNATCVIAAGAAAGGNLGQLLRSTDAITWNGIGFANEEWRSIAYSPTLSRWCVVGKLAAAPFGCIRTSDDDGVSTWTNRTSPITGTTTQDAFTGVVWSGDRFVAVTANMQLAWSLDGITWVAGPASTSALTAWPSIAADPATKGIVIYGTATRATMDNRLKISRLGTVVQDLEPIYLAGSRVRYIANRNQFVFLGRSEVPAAHASFGLRL